MLAASIEKGVNRKHHLRDNRSPLLGCNHPHLSRVSLPACNSQTYFAQEREFLLLYELALIFRYSGAEAPVFIPKGIRLSVQTAINYSATVKMEIWMDK